MRSFFRTSRLTTRVALALCAIVAFALIDPVQAADAVLQIETTQDAQLGTHEYVAITSLEVADGFQWGGFNLLIEYDSEYLSLVSVNPGQALTDCDWEYFTYRYGPSDACPDSADLGSTVAVIAIANTNNGANYPDCYLETPGELAVIDFLVTDQDSAGCQFSPVRWLWCDCSRNVISSLSGDTIFVSDSVYSMYYVPWYNITVDEPFPTHGGANSDCPDSNIIRAIDFVDGGVDIACADSIDHRGDVNLNGSPYEIADFILFANWFYIGGSVFNVSSDGQVIATDVNANGIPLELADLVYLVRIIVGDALPFPIPPATPVGDTMVITQDMVTKVITIDYPDSINGMFMVFVGDLRPWNWGDDPDRPFDGLHTKVLVVGFISGDDTLFYQDPFMPYTGEGTLLSAVASYDGLSHIPIRIQFTDIPGCCAARGNVDSDPDGIINIMDLLYLVNHLFGVGAAPPCPPQADLNGDDLWDIADVVYLVNYMFSSGPAPVTCR